MKAGAAGLGGLAALALLLPMEAGVPIPLPADLVMFTVGERVAAGKFPLWLAVTGFEVISVLGTTALFLPAAGLRIWSSPGSGRVLVSPRSGSAGGPTSWRRAACPRLR